MIHHSDKIRPCLNWASQTVMLLLVVVLTVSCERRELYVYGDEYYSMQLEIDWRDFDDMNPDGTTVYFYPLDDATTRAAADGYTNSHDPFWLTTADVTRPKLFVPNGRYQVLVFSYSPQEYGRQVFKGMNSVHDARMELAENSYQAKDLSLPGEFVTDSAQTATRSQLFGDKAWNANAPRRPETREGGLYTVSSQPEDIGADTLDNRAVNVGGVFSEYIPWKEREGYQQTISMQTMKSVPHTLQWIVHVKVYIKKGFDNLWSTRATVAGLADGHFLARNVNSDQPTILYLDEWSTKRIDENSGWVNCTFSSLGLCPADVKADRQLHPSTISGKSIRDGRQCDIGAYYSQVLAASSMRLNLAFVLRDHKTVVSRHYNVGKAVVSFDDQMVINVELDDDFYKDPDSRDPDDPDPGIILPDVDPYGSTDFDADVDPWQDEPPVDIDM